MSISFQTAVVTGASRGFGRAIAAALVTSGTGVVGVARDERQLSAVRHDLGRAFTPLPADATDEALAHEVIREHRPGLIVLNAGAAPHLAPLHEQTWETFSRNWHADTRHVFAWIRAGLREPLTPGSVIVTMSSGAAQGGSPLSGGYAGAKAAIGHISRYAAEESKRAGLDIRLVTLYPQLTPATALGSAAVAAYAARQGVDPGTLAEGMRPILTAEQVARAVVDLAHDPGSAAEYRITASGPHPID